MAGFLGSGKTTILLPMAGALIEQSSKVVIIENEMGEIGIDGSYLAREGLQVQELFGGCICCTLSVGLVESIDKIEGLYHPEVIVVEATGIARPGDLKKTIFQYNKCIEKIDTVTVVDAQRYEVLRHALAPLFEAQIDAADIVVLNKIDTIDGQAVRDISTDIGLINPDAKLHTVSMDESSGFEALLRDVL